MLLNSIQFQLDQTKYQELKCREFHLKDLTKMDSTEQISHQQEEQLWSLLVQVPRELVCPQLDWILTRAQANSLIESLLLSPSLQETLVPPRKEWSPHLAELKQVTHLLKARAP